MAAKKPATKRAKSALQALLQRPYCAKRFGIQNHFGGVWTPENFNTEKEAQEYLDNARQTFHGRLPKHKVVPVNVTIRIVR